MTPFAKNPDDEHRGFCIGCKDPVPVRHDFCADCGGDETGCTRDSFGRCYECKDGCHEACYGPPCQCSCPNGEISAARRAESEALRASALAKLTPAERAALGV